MTRRAIWEVIWITIKKNGIEIQFAAERPALVAHTKMPHGGAATAFPKRPTGGEEVK
jgi:hypothetical protein